MSIAMTEFARSRLFPRDRRITAIQDCSVEEFVHELNARTPERVIPGYAPFCVLHAHRNWTSTRCSVIAITDENRHRLRRPMISNIQINFSNQTFLHLFPYTLSTDKPNLVLFDLIEHSAKPMLIQITHHHINTFLDLSLVFDLVLLYFDENNEFIGASYSLDSGIGGTFVLLTQARSILLLPFSFDINLPRVKNLEISFPKNSN